MFIHAVLKGRVDLVKIFLGINPVFYSTKVLREAVLICIKKNEESQSYRKILINIIIQSKLDLDFEDENNKPPLQLAVQSQNVKLVKILLKGKCNVNYKNSRNGE